MDEQTMEEQGQEAQTIDRENQREQLISELQEDNRQFQAENKALRELLLSHDMGTDLEDVLASLDKP